MLSHLVRIFLTKLRNIKGPPYFPYLLNKWFHFFLSDSKFSLNKKWGQEDRMVDLYVFGPSCKKIPCNQVVHAVILMILKILKIFDILLISKILKTKKIQNLKKFHPCVKIFSQQNSFNTAALILHGLETPYIWTSECAVIVTWPNYSALPLSLLYHSTFRTH